MNRSELIKILAKKVNIKEKSAEKMVTAFCDTITGALQKGDKVVYSNFGTFYTVHYPSKVIYHPVLGEKKKMVMLPTDAVKWMPSGNIKDMVDRGTEREEITRFGSSKKLKEEKKKAGISDKKAVEVSEEEIRRMKEEEETVEIPIKIMKKTTEAPIEAPEEEAEKEITPFASPHAQISYVDLSETKIPSEILCLVPLEVAKKTKVVPIDLKDEMLILGMADPKDLDTIEMIKKTVRKKVSPRLISESDLDKIFAQYEGAALLAHKEPETAKEADEQSDSSLVFAKSTPSQRILGLILKRALRDKTKNIHFDLAPEELTVRFRLGGKAVEKTKLNKVIGKAVIAKLKTLAGINEKPEGLQEGILTYDIDGETEEFDFLSIPAAGGEKIVLTLKERLKEIRKLEGLDLREGDLVRIKENIRKPGLTLVAGPSNKERTALLYALADYLKTEGLSVVSAEENVDLVIPGITQIQVNDEKPYERVLELITKLDPDVLIIDRIPSAELFNKVSVLFSGKIVISSAEGNDSVSAFAGLRSLGITENLLADRLNLLISTRSIPRICPECRSLEKLDGTMIKKIREELSTIPSEERARLRKLGSHFYIGKGCGACNGLGSDETIFVHEVMNPNNKIRERLKEPAPDLDAIKKEAVKNGMTTIAQDSIIKALVGLVATKDIFEQ